MAAGVSRVAVFLQADQETERGEHSDDKVESRIDRAVTYRPFSPPPQLQEAEGVELLLEDQEEEGVGRRLRRCLPSCLRRRGIPPAKEPFDPVRGLLPQLLEQLAVLKDPRYVRGEDEIVPHPREDGKTRMICGTYVPDRELSGDEEQKRALMRQLEYRMRSEADWEAKLENNLLKALLSVGNVNPEFEPGKTDFFVKILQVQFKTLTKLVNASKLGKTGISATALAAQFRLSMRQPRVNEDVVCFSTLSHPLPGGEMVSIILRGVFDGHGGWGAAQALKYYLPIYLMNRLQMHCPKEMTNKGIADAGNFSLIDLSRKMALEKLSIGGSCANFSLEYTAEGVKKVAVFNLADSSCIMVPKKGLIKVASLSEDMKLASKYDWKVQEGESIETYYQSFFDEIMNLASIGEEKGAMNEARYQLFKQQFQWLKNPIRRGLLQRTYDCSGRIFGLNIPRIVGDSKSGFQILSALPKLVIITPESVKRIFGRQVKEVIIIHMTDGVTDVASKEQIGTFFRELLDIGLDMKEAAKGLIAYVKSLGSSDDCTLVVDRIQFE